MAKSITIENSAGAVNHKAAALCNGSDQSAFQNCRFLGCQDTALRTPKPPILQRLRHLRHRRLHLRPCKRRLSRLSYLRSLVHLHRCHSARPSKFKRCQRLLFPKLHGGSISRGDPTPEGEYEGVSGSAVGELLEGDFHAELSGRRVGPERVGRVAAETGGCVVLRGVREERLGCRYFKRE